MRIALVSPYDLASHGGVQDQVMRLHRWLGEEGHDAWIVAPGSGGPEGTVHVGTSTAVPINRSLAPIALDPRIRDAVRAAIDTADVVHIHEPLVPVVGLAALMADAAPKVVTFHADPSPLIKGLYRLAAPLLKRWIGRAGRATAVSQKAADAVAPITVATVVPNGIDVDAYSEGNVERRSNEVAFLGRDDPRKGLDVLLQAWPEVRVSVPQARLSVIGATRTDVIPGVEWRGRVDEATKRHALQGAAIYCAPNTGGESFGIVLVEAMAAGCAVVASDLESFAAVVGEAGMLVPAGDAEGLADTLVTLLESPELVAELAGRSRQRAQLFDRDTVLAGYVAAYEAALAD